MSVESRPESAKTNGQTPAQTPAVAEAVAPAKSRRPLLALLAVLTVVGAAAGGYVVLTAGKENTDDAQISADIVPLGTRVAGQVTRVVIHDNQLVKKGELIAEIDDSDYRAKVKQAEAEVASARAQVAAAEAQVKIAEASSKGNLSSAKAAYSGSSVGVASAEAQAAASQAAVARAETDLRKAEGDLKRAQELRAANAAPQEKLDNAQAAHDAAVAALAQAKAQFAAGEEAKRAAQARVSEAYGRLTLSTPIEAQMAAAQANADLARARLEGATAALSLAQLQLSYTKIAAPTDGMASQLAVHEGQLVSVGQPVVELVPTKTYVVANFKETQVGHIQAGQTASIKIDAYPHREFAAKVESLSGGTGSSFSLLPADNASGNFVKVVQRVPVRLAWIDVPPDVALRAGLSADVTVDVGR
jgi:membrane fusion protein (multidrug efflux system)